MPDIHFLTTLLSNIYGAEVLPEDEASRWLNTDENLVIGFKFPDAKKAYYLLTMNDYRLLTREQYEFHAVHREYPFPDLRFILFKDQDGNICYRITNGVAGALDNMIQAWENWN